jgi:hypothetical protein
MKEKRKKPGQNILLALFLALVLPLGIVLLTTANPVEAG